MLLIVIVKKSLKQYFRDVQTTVAATGILGIMVCQPDIIKIHSFISASPFRETKVELPSEFHSFHRQPLRMTRNQHQTLSISQVRQLLHLWTHILLRSMKWLTSEIRIFMNYLRDYCSKRTISGRLFRPQTPHQSRSSANKIVQPVRRICLRLLNHKARSLWRGGQ